MTEPKTDDCPVHDATDCATDAYTPQDEPTTDVYDAPDAETSSQLLADSAAAMEEKPFIAENAPYPTTDEIQQALAGPPSCDTQIPLNAVPNTPARVFAKSYTLEVQPDITAAEAVQLALFCFAQVLAKNPEVGITVNGMVFENFARHFKETV